MSKNNSSLRGTKKDTNKLFSKIDNFEGNNLASEIDSWNLWINNIDYINENSDWRRINNLFLKIKEIFRGEHQVSDRRLRRLKWINGL